MLSVRDLIIRSQKGDKEARNQIITQNLGLVWSIVHRFTGRGYDAEDLFQIGSIGLMKAIDRFDVSYEVQFSTYAVPMISGEIKRFLRDDGLIKVSRTIKENQWKISRCMQTLQSQQAEAMTLEEISQATGLTKEEILLAMDANTEVDSLNKPVSAGDGKELYLEDQICDKQNENEKIDNRILLEQLLGELNAKERRLIYMRYFQDCTQSEVAKALNMSQVQVSRLEKKLLCRMRESVK